MVFCTTYGLIIVFGTGNVSVKFELLEECRQHMFEKLQFDAQ